jgi:hypothetical protein
VNEKSAQAGALLYQARVVVSNDKRLIVRMEQPIPGRAFSGAPVLNAQGEVAGMMLGSSQAGGAHYFLLNPATAIRERLKQSPGTVVAQP